MSDRIDELYIEWLERQIEEWDGQPPPDDLPDFEMDPPEGDDEHYQT